MIRATHLADDFVRTSVFNKGTTATVSMQVKSSCLYKIAVCDPRRINPRVVNTKNSTCGIEGFSADLGNGFAFQRRQRGACRKRYDRIVAALGIAISR